MKGKTIKLFLIDGQPNGRIQCELSNWTGKAYRIPRNQIKRCDDRTDLDSAGVYILLGKEDDGHPCAYIGEADGIRERMKQHLAHKEFWNEVIIFISKDNNLNKAHVRYLERRLYQIAQEADRYLLKNTNVPGGANISEADEAEMEEFIDNLKIIINALGVKIFESVRENQYSPIEQAQNTFMVKNNRGADAKGLSTSEGFVVLKGSAMTHTTTSSCPERIQMLRNSLVEEGIVEDHIFIKDYLFSSPSTAAGVVMGMSANGLKEWHLESGKTLKEFE